MSSCYKIILIFLLIMVQNIEGNLTISKVVVRVPHENDIGIIFDLTVTNTVFKNQPEQLEFIVRPEKGCRLFLCPPEALEDAGRIMGGDFGAIEAGTSMTVSLIWPTTSLYNRRGTCPIVITSTNPQKKQIHIKKELTFDTTFTTLDPESTGIRKSKYFQDCGNYDLNYFNNCTPVDCEERYFGRRSFFNQSTKHCEEVPRCVGRMYYDPFANECVDSQYTITKKDIYDIKNGNFKEYDEWLALTSHNTDPQFIQPPEVNIKTVKRGFVPDIPMDPGATYWLKGIIDGLMLVFATIGIYVLICFVIFCIVSCISRRQSGRNSVTFSQTPSISEKGINLPSRSSILKK